MKMTMPKFAPYLGAIGPIVIELVNGEAPGGTVVVTPADGGAGGTFSPTTLNLTNTVRSGSFMYTAAGAGTPVISVTNNGGLTNPPSQKLYTPHNKVKKGVLVLIGMEPSSAYRIRRRGDVSNELTISTDANGNANTQALLPDLNYVIYGPKGFRREVTIDRENIVIEPKSDVAYLQVATNANGVARVDAIGHTELTQFVTTNSNGVGMIPVRYGKQYRVKIGDSHKVVKMDGSKTVVLP